MCKRYDTCFFFEYVNVLGMIGFAYHSLQRPTFFITRTVTRLEQYTLRCAPFCVPNMCLTIFKLSMTLTLQPMIFQICTMCSFVLLGFLGFFLPKTPFPQFAGTVFLVPYTVGGVGVFWTILTLALAFNVVRTKNNDYPRRETAEFISIIVIIGTPWPGGKESPH